METNSSCSSTQPQPQPLTAADRKRLIRLKRQARSAQQNVAPAEKKSRSSTNKVDQQHYTYTNGRSRSKPHSSLFGAVMKQNFDAFKSAVDVPVDYSEQSSLGLSTSRMSRSASCSSSRHHYDHNEPGRNNIFFRNPEKHKGNDENSNSGFAILKVLDNMTNFRVVEETRLTGNSHSQDSNGGRSREHAASEIDNWRHASISLPAMISDDGGGGNRSMNSGINIVDWSLKRTIQIECHPGSVLPGLRSGHGCIHYLPMDRQYAVEHAARELLLTDHRRATLQSLSSKEERAAAQWIAGAMYWQHPTQHPLPSNILSTKLPQQPSLFSGKHAAIASKPGFIGSISNIIRKSIFNNRARAVGKGSLGGMGSSAEKQVSTVDLMYARKRDWQDAFRSMYFTWLGKIAHIDKRRREENDKISLSDMPCFYAVSPGRIILFRCARRDGLHFDIGENDDGGGYSSVEASANDMIPLILISSSSLDFRNRLRSYGVRIMFTGGNEFHEPTNDENEVYKKEVEALRREWNTGDMAGVEININTRDKRAGRYPPLDQCTLSIAGEDDCQSFYEIFFGSYGSLHMGRKCEKFDVPLLLTRSLGPCLHMSLRQLVVSERIEGVEEDGSNGSQQYSTVTMRGPILPCAVHDLLSATASHLVLDKNREEEINDSPTAVVEQHLLNEIGSHYFTAEMATHEGETIEDSNTLGDASSAWFNRQVKSSEDSVKECPEGCVISTVLWASNNERTVDYMPVPAASSILPQYISAKNR